MCAGEIRPAPRETIAPRVRASTASSLGVSRSKSRVPNPGSHRPAATALLRGLRRLLPLPCANNTSPPAPMGLARSPSTTMPLRPVSGPPARRACPSPPHRDDGRVQLLGRLVRRLAEILVPQPDDGEVPRQMLRGHVSAGMEWSLQLGMASSAQFSPDDLAVARDRVGSPGVSEAGNDRQPPSALSVEAWDRQVRQSRRPVIDL